MDAICEFRITNTKDISKQIYVDQESFKEKILKKLLDKKQTGGNNETTNMEETSTINDTIKKLVKYYTNENNDNINVDSY